LFKIDEDDSAAFETGSELDDNPTALDSGFFALDSGTVPLDKADVADEEDSSKPEDAGSPELEDTPIAGEDSAPTVTGAVEDESSPQALNTNDNATQKAKTFFIFSSSIFKVRLLLLSGCSTQQGNRIEESSIDIGRLGKLDFILYCKGYLRRANAICQGRARVQIYLDNKRIASSRNINALNNRPTTHRHIVKDNRHAVFVNILSGRWIGAFNHIDNKGGCIFRLYRI
jgi:hypothetical protein